MFKTPKTSFPSEWVCKNNSKTAFKKHRYDRKMIRFSFLFELKGEICLKLLEV